MNDLIGPLRRAPVITKPEAFMKINKDAFEAELDRDFEAHCTEKSLEKKGEKKAARMGYRATWLSKKWASADATQIAEVEEFIKATLDDKEREELERYSWIDRDKISDDELKRRNDNVTKTKLVLV